VAARVGSSHFGLSRPRGERGGNQQTLFFVELLAVWDLYGVNLGGMREIREAMRPPPNSRRFPKTFPSDQCVDANSCSPHGWRVPSRVERADGIEPKTTVPSKPIKWGVFVGSSDRCVRIGANFSRYEGQL